MSDLGLDNNPVFVVDFGDLFYGNCFSWF